MSLICSTENRHGQDRGGTQRTEMDEVNKRGFANMSTINSKWAAWQCLEHMSQSGWCTWREDMEKNRRKTRAGRFSYACDPVEGILAQPHTSTDVVKI